MAEAVLELDGMPLVLHVGGKVFDLYHGQDGTLYIEASGDERLHIVVSDEDMSEATVDGLWANIDLVLPEES